MRKIVFILSSLLAGVISCSSCTHNDSGKTNPTNKCDDSGCPFPDSGKEDSAKDSGVLNRFSGSTWEFLAPPGWEENKVDLTPQEEIYLVNETQGGVIFLVKEKFDDTIDAYTLFAIRGLKDTGSTLISQKQVVLNGVSYNLLISQKNTRSMWLWVTKAGDYCYGFVCGGKTSDFGNQLDCFAAADSLKIK